MREQFKASRLEVFCSRFEETDMSKFKVRLQDTLRVEKTQITYLNI